MRILLTYVTVGRGGDAVQLLALGRALRGQGHEASLTGASRVSPYTFDSLEARARSLVRRLPWWVRDLIELGLSVGAAGRALRAIQTRRPDLVIHRAAAYDFMMGFIARRGKVPLVLYLDAHVESERAFRGEPYWRSLHAWAMRTLGRAATVIVTPSRAIAGYYASLGLPADKIVVRKNGVSERHLRMGLEAVDSHPPLNGAARCTLGFVGSLSKWHGVDLLFNALQYLNNGSHEQEMAQAGGAPAYRLVIVGRGGEHDALRAQAQLLGLGPAIEWRGSLSHDDAVRAMREFDIAVLPNTLHTGTPMKLAEYAAMGRPIVAPDRPNIRDMFTDGREIVLIRPGDPADLARAIQRLAAGPNEARRIGRAAQARILDHTWEETVDLLLRRVAQGDHVSPTVPAYAAAGESSNARAT